MGFLRHGRRKPKMEASATGVSTEGTPAAGSPAGGSQADDSPTGNAQVDDTIIDDLNEETPTPPEEPNAGTPAVSFASACKAGFPGDFVEFLRAYRLGFASLPEQEQRRFIYHYIAHLDRKGGFNGFPPHYPDFGEIFRKYVDAEAGSTSEEHDLYQATIDAYLVGLKDGRLPAELSFQAFLKRVPSATL